MNGEAAPANGECEVSPPTSVSPSSRPTSLLLLRLRSSHSISPFAFPTSYHSSNSLSLPLPCLHPHNQLPPITKSSLLLFPSRKVSGISFPLFSTVFPSLALVLRLQVPIIVIYESIDCVAWSRWLVAIDFSASSTNGVLRRIEVSGIQITLRRHWCLRPRCCLLAASRVEDCPINMLLDIHTTNIDENWFRIAIPFVISPDRDRCGLWSDSGVYRAISRVTGFPSAGQSPGRPSLTASLLSPRDSRTLPLTSFFFQSRSCSRLTFYFISFLPLCSFYIFVFLFKLLPRSEGPHHSNASH